MARTDLIADALSNILSAARAKKESAVLPSSKLLNSIIEIMKDNGSLENFRIQTNPNGINTIKVYLKYSQDKSPVLKGLKKISRPGLRKYVDNKHIPAVLRGQGFAIISTSKGIMTDAQAREQKLGGEVICYVW